jgi:arginase
LANHAETAAYRHDLTLTLGGDHGLSAGTILGALRRHRDLSVIWVDAHGDINTPETSESGNFHGMPLAFLLNLAQCRKKHGFQWMGSAALDPKRLALVGVRSLDTAEVEIIRELGIKVITADEVREMGGRAAALEALNHVWARGESPLHLSFDLDALDPTVAPATGTAVPQGLSLGEAKALGQQLAATGQLTSVDVVEFNPDFAADRFDLSITARNALSLVDAWVGEMVSTAEGSRGQEGSLVPSLGSNRAYGSSTNSSY